LLLNGLRLQKDSSGKYVLTAKGKREWRPKAAASSGGSGGSGCS
jgi:hypothetical protein